MLANNTKVKILANSRIKINSPKCFGVKIGFGGTDGIVEGKYSYLKIGENASLVFDGTAEIAQGSSIRIDSGILHIGDNKIMDIENAKQTRINTILFNEDTKNVIEKIEKGEEQA